MAIYIIVTYFLCVAVEYLSCPCRPGNEIMYGFAHFTSTLNEPEEGVAPTDSRFRPDQRIMEEGDFPKADKEKVYYCSYHN